MNDEDLFASEMSDVKPLQLNTKVSLRSQPLSSEQLALRRRSATEVKIDDNPLSNTEIALLDPYVPLEFKRSGVQNGVFRRLKQGAYSFDARLDLHGLTVEQARSEVFGFVNEALEQDLRSAIIIHGRGRHSDSQGPILKSYINHWLRELEPVQAFVSAQGRDGGVGAVYVLLRKSDKNKQANRERLAKGRSR